METPPFIPGLISFCMPSMRPEGMLDTLTATIAAAGKYRIEFFVVTENYAVVEALQSFPCFGNILPSPGAIYDVWHIFRKEPTGPIAAWNDGLRKASGEYICFWSDDLKPHEGFLDKALPCFQQFPDGVGYVAFNDLHNKPEVLTTHYIAHRQYIVRFQGGVLAYPCYHRLFNDTESMCRARAAGRFAYAPDAIAEHLHPACGKRPTDRWDQLMTAAWSHDYAMFQCRRARGFPNDFPPVIAQ